MNLVAVATGLEIEISVVVAAKVITAVEIVESAAIAIALPVALEIYSKYLSLSLVESCC